MDASHYQPQWQQPYPSNLSLNLSSLSVTSPAALSPATPISPPFTGQIHQSFQFDTYDDRPPTSRRKRSFSTNSAGLVDYDVDAASYASEEMPHSGYADGNGSGSDEQRSQPSTQTSSSTSTMPSAGINVLGKPMGTNNFVTKLYQMINDSKSQHFISWTELGTSFVVSNVGEFSRSILGSHFKHNNFSSFVRQLNMYGFHKINRTPRAQRTSTDAQTWEFSHPKFLRGRPDLLDEIKRKALEPDPGVKHRVELPGEVVAQLNALRDENHRVWEQLAAERRRTERLVGLVGRLWDVVGKNLPGGLPPFPTDLADNENPNIYVTSPTSSRFPPPLSISNLTGQRMNISTPSSSPTAPDFPLHGHSHSHSHYGHNHNHSHSHSHSHSHGHLSRQQSIQHISFSRNGTSGANTGTENLSASSTPLQPSSPRSMSMDLFDEGGAPPSGTGPNTANVNGGNIGNGSNATVNGGAPSNGNGNGGGNGNGVGAGHNHGHGHGHGHGNGSGSGHPNGSGTGNVTVNSNAGGATPGGTPGAGGPGDHSPNGRVSTKRQRLSTDEGIGVGIGVGGGMSIGVIAGMNGSSDSLSPLPSSNLSSPGSGGPPGMVVGVQHGVQHGIQHGVPGVQHGVGVGLGVGVPGVGVGVVNGKKASGSRARSDSAPLGYGFSGLTSWGATGASGPGGPGASGGLNGIIGRPRSGSGLAGPRGVPNIGTMTRGGVTSGVSGLGVGVGGVNVGVGALGGGVSGVGGNVGVPALLSVPSLPETR